MIAFIAEFVPPGVPFEDEPSEMVPTGWHVRLDGLSAEDRQSETWQDHWFVQAYLGEGDVDHAAAVVLAHLANERWERAGRAPDFTGAALRGAVTELGGGGR